MATLKSSDPYHQRYQSVKGVGPSFRTQPLIMLSDFKK